MNRRISADKYRGFTLIELLVVILIIGVLLGITLLSPLAGSVQKEVRQQAERIQLLFAQARERALIENHEYGFSLEGDRKYRWWVYLVDTGEWVPLSEKPWHSHQVPESIRLTMHRDVAAPTLKSGEEQKQMPDVVIFSDRQVTPFRLEVVPVDNEKQKMWLETDGLSSIEAVRSE